ncbi:hypothetical protein [Terracoccus luteus]|uniref:Uncharacterized protein n=1 Tax=Terracoccus luteus TaxID=53356 RepID=A0A839Q1H6_9MICO|nr:hypothetical protein [Terracoccus luteus]MBB2988116.1 hypothetical protein [Terracoccus luteus]MCP2174144.1 hypothetical protein [Terracoccus luteus]
MTAQPQPIHPQAARRITVTPATLTLPDGSSLTINDHVPTTPTDRRDAALHAQLYFYGGHIDTPTGPLGGYLGESGHLDGPRAASSLSRWVINQRRITPTGMALLTSPHPAYTTSAFRKLVEARTLMNLSARNLWLLNTHTNAGLATAHLTRAHVKHAHAIATTLADHIHTEIFNSHHNGHPSPAANNREHAVRVVLHADRALDTYEVMRALRAAGITTNARTWTFTIRRDLVRREAETRSIPRVFSTTHRGRRLYWNPQTLSKNAAIAGYDLAHP